MKDIVDKHIQTISLLDTYQMLLTPKQQTIMNYYFYDNYSLSEIADLLNISRNAIHDHIKRVSEKLITYEQKLGLLKNKEKREKLLLELTQKTTNLDIIKLIEELKKVE